MKRQPYSTRQQKIDWLLEHESLWEGNSVFNYAEKYIGMSERIVELMKADGLISPKTYWPDVQIPSLIIDARQQKQERKATNDN